MAAYIYENELVLTVHTTESGALFLCAIFIQLGLQSNAISIPTINCAEAMISVETFPNIVSVLKREDDITYDVLWNPEFREQRQATFTIGTGFLSFAHIFQVKVENPQPEVAYRHVKIENFKRKGPLRLPGESLFLS